MFTSLEATSIKWIKYIVVITKKKTFWITKVYLKLVCQDSDDLTHSKHLGWHTHCLFSFLNFTYTHCLFSFLNFACIWSLLSKVLLNKNVWENQFTKLYNSFYPWFFIIIQNHHEIKAKISEQITYKTWIFHNIMCCVDYLTMHLFSFHLYASLLFTYSRVPKNRTINKILSENIKNMESLNELGTLIFSMIQQWDRFF